LSVDQTLPLRLDLAMQDYVSADLKLNSAQGVLMLKLQMQVDCPVLLWGLATIWIGVWWSHKYSADDASINLSLATV